MQLVPATQFSLEEITEAYNESRVDYIVPMPMNVARLNDYIHRYDIDLSASCVAVEPQPPFRFTKLGLALLGVRDERAWITRMGVLPSGRRKGVGSALMEHLLQSAADRELNTIWLEVIKDNIPAHKLFLKYGFTETRELLVARRPPTAVINMPQILAKKTITKISTLHRAEILRRMARRQMRQNWLLETESMRNVPNLSAFSVELSDGSQGWVSYNASMFKLSRIYVDVLVGDVAQVTAAALLTLHRYNRVQDAIIENLPTADPRWPGFQAMGYFEAFRRIEMVRQ